jgi:hypothetical protein
MPPNPGASPSSRMRGEFPLSEANRPVMRLLSWVVTAGRCRSCLGVSEGRWRREGEAMSLRSMWKNGDKTIMRERQAESGG